MPKRMTVRVNNATIRSIAKKMGFKGYKRPVSVEAKRAGRVRPSHPRKKRGKR